MHMYTGEKAIINFVSIVISFKERGGRIEEGHLNNVHVYRGKAIIYLA